MTVQGCNKPCFFLNFSKSKVGFLGFLVYVLQGYGNCDKSLNLIIYKLVLN